jgi:hypothetical protein
MKKLNKIYLVLFVLLLTGCSASEEKDILEFSFLEENNDIPENSVEIIAETWIDVYLPRGIDSTSLIATFSISDKATVTINRVVQNSDFTVNDFSSPVEYTILAEDGSEKHYIVTLILSDFFELDKNVIQLMQNHNIPGISLGIIKGENLVYSKPYGVADITTDEKATNNSLFRIASVSKVITAIAILKLLEDGILEFSNKVFGENGILEFDYGTPPYRSEVEDITVAHLLNHQTGWNSYFMLIDSYKETMDNLIDNEPFSYPPGTDSQYNNVGYFILGRVIEKLTGLSYKVYVKNEILTPAQVTGMEIGLDPNEGKYPNEVRYLDQDNTSPHPNNFNLTYMDSYGGWLSTSYDLLRFMVSFDKLNSKSDILLPSTINNMIFGNNSWLYDGNFSGTAAFIEKINNVFSYAIIANTKTESIIYDMRDMMRYSINNKSDWPDNDLFDE